MPSTEPLTDMSSLDMLTRLTDCPDCEDGSVDVCTGWRQTGSGYGDCEQTWATVECETCGGSGLVEAA